MKSPIAFAAAFSLAGLLTVGCGEDETAKKTTSAKQAPDKIANSHFPKLEPCNPDSLRTGTSNCGPRIRGDRTKIGGWHITVDIPDGYTLNNPGENSPIDSTATPRLRIAFTPSPTGAQWQTSGQLTKRDKGLRMKVRVPSQVLTGMQKAVEAGATRLIYFLVDGLPVAIRDYVHDPGKSDLHL